MADSTLSNLTSLTLPSQATDLLLVGRGTARPNKVAMSDALNSAALAATTAAYGVVLLAPNGGTTAGTVVQANDSRLTGGGGGGVTSLAGTANQITASASTGAVTLSLPSTLILPGTLTVSGTANSSFAGSVNIRKDQAGITALLVDNQNTAGTADLFLTQDGGSANYFRISRNGSGTATPNVVNISNVVAGAAGTTAIEFGSPVKVLNTTNSSSAITGALTIGNGTNGGIGVSGRSFFAEQVNVKSIEATGTASAYNSTGGIALFGAAGSAYAGIKAYSDAAGTEKTIGLNTGNQAGVAIGSVGPAAAGSLLTTGNVTTTDVKLNTTDLSMRSVAADRAIRQKLAFDGTRGVTCSTPILSGDWTVAFVVNRQSSAVQQYLIGNDVSGCFYLGFRTGGFLYSGKALGSANTDMNLGNVVGVTQHIVVTKSGTTQTCYADGVSVGSITDSQTYTAAATTLFAADGAGSAALIGTGAVIGFYNRALSAAEVAQLFRDGDPDRTDYNNASNTAINVASVVNGNQSGLYLYDTFTGASATGFTAVKTQTTTEADVYGGEGYTVASGQRMLVSFNCTLTSGALPLLYFSNFTNAPLYNVGVRITAGANAILVPINATGTAVRLRFYSPTAETVNYAISNLSVTRLGLTLAPDAAQPGGSYLWYDTSGNARTTTLPNSGVKWDTPTGGYNPQESSVNGSLGFLARNNSTGNAAVSAIDLQNENGASYGIGLRYFGNSFAQVNAYRANRGLLYGAFDINFLSGQYKFWFGGPGAGLDNSVAYEGFNLYGPSVSTGTATVGFTTPSTAFGTGALNVGGGASFGGALFSQQNSNSIVTGTNFANVNAGTAATLRHTLTAGTNNSTIEAYSNGHATLAGRLRFGTNNGQMDFVPSGVLGMSISASGVTVPNPLTVSGTSTVDGLATSAFFGGTKRVAVGYDTANDYGWITAVDTGVSWKQLRLNPNGGRVVVPGTDAATNTTSGALVIGNGTNGGLGVSGNIVTGGNIEVQADKGVYQKQGNVHKWTSDGASTGTSRADIYADSAGVLYFRTNGATEALSLNASQTATFAGTILANAASNAFRIANSQTPASQTASGTQGQITWDASYLYVCTSTNNWGRSSLNWAGGGGGGGSTNVWIPASAWIPRTTTGAGIDSREQSTNKINTDELLFDAGTDEFAQAMIVMPSNWNAGTVTAKFHWTASTGSGDVVWGLQGRAYANDDALDQAMGTAQTATDTLTATNDVDISPATSAITLGGTAASGNPVIFQVYRDADAGGDTLANDARLLGVEISYTAS